jgi:hypothetical protein
MCDTLAAVATRHELPADFRLIWQESRFNSSAVSFKGAQGIAQFMPGTARQRGLEDSFDPGQAIPESAELLRDLNREFGNLGLAAAAYNAGSGRVYDWLAGRKPLPGETVAYVRLVTGRSAEEWAGRQKTAEPAGAACTQAGLTIPDAAGNVPLPRRPVPAWGAEVAGGPTQAKALRAIGKCRRSTRRSSAAASHTSSSAASSATLARCAPAPPPRPAPTPTRCAPRSVPPPGPAT